MSLEENKAFIKRMMDERIKGNADAVREMYAPDVVRHIHGRVKDYEEITKNISTEPWDRTVIFDEMIAEGDKVALWFTGKKEGDDRHWCFIVRIANGKVAEEWNMIGIQSEGKRGGKGSLP